MKQIIINADDFGRHVLINRAVETAVQEGMLRSATIMAGGAAFADAAELAVRTPALGVGIHLTLVDAAPVLPPAEIPTLVTAEGRFLPDHT
ncbi:ChbG/HpnK family deacetylase, partial [Selenomonas sp.]|uniref:ChbG/HpnK family deacetylase n=1 Tax=Selenomonas sp. TaxID=2053611 RepID=UPI001CB11678